MAISFNIFEATRQAFNLAGFQLAIGSKEQPINIDNSSIEVFETAEAIGNSIFDTPIFETIAIKHPTSGELIYFDDAPMIEVGLKKHIVKSVVTGRLGTVKESTGKDDYKIKIRGILVNHLGEAPPHDKAEALRSLLFPDVALEVESKLLQALNIFNIVVEDFKLIPSEQYTNIIPYEFSCISDEPVELSSQNHVNIAQFS